MVQKASVRIFDVEMICIGNEKSRNNMHVEVYHFMLVSYNVDNIFVINCTVWGKMAVSGDLICRSEI